MSSDGPPSRSKDELRAVSEVLLDTADFIFSFTVRLYRRTIYKEMPTITSRLKDNMEMVIAFVDDILELLVLLLDASALIPSVPAGGRVGGLDSKFKLMDVTFP